MSKSLEKKRIVPFNPRSFPPRNLKGRSFAMLLKKAKEALREFHSTLALSPPWKQIFSSFLTIEAMDSLDSQKICAPFTDVIQGINQSQIAPINDYLEALEWASHGILKIPFSKKQICKIHKIVKRSSAHQSDVGRYRNRQNWIGPVDCNIDQAYFYPPAFEKVDPLMDQLFRYLNQSKKEPLVQLALSFAQLLIIHPFMDGNGRVARILVPLFLYKKKVLPLPCLFLSGYFKIHRLQYFKTLFNTTEDEKWEDWIIFFLKGIIQSARKQNNAFIKTFSLYDDLKTKAPKLKRAPREFLFQFPIFSRTAFHKAKGTISDLNELKRLKFIKQSKNNKYIFTPLMKILK